MEGFIEVENGKLSEFTLERGFVGFIGWVDSSAIYLW